MPRLNLIKTSGKSLVIAPSDDWEDLLQQFLLYRKAHGLKDSTIENQRDYLINYFKNFFNNWAGLKESVYRFLSEDIKAATYNLRVSYLKGFLEWCCEEGIIENNPLHGFKRRKSQPRVVLLDENQLKELLQIPDRTTFAGFRDYCLILLTLDTGIRPNEALSLIIGDINFRAEELYVRDVVSKTKVSRSLPLSMPTLKNIRQLISVRHQMWAENAPVFCTVDGQKMSSHSWGCRMVKYSAILGFKVRPYDLRHSFAVQFIRGGGNALALQKIMGHADLNMTKWYVKLNQSDLREQHAAASPVNKLFPIIYRRGKN